MGMRQRLHSPRCIGVGDIDWLDTAYIRRLRPTAQQARVPALLQGNANDNDLFFNHCLLYTNRIVFDALCTQRRVSDL